MTKRKGDERTRQNHIYPETSSVGEAEWQFRNKSLFLWSTLFSGKWQENLHLFTDCNESLLRTSLLASVKLLAVKIFFYSSFPGCFDERCALNCKGHTFKQQVPVTWQLQCVGNILQTWQASYLQHTIILVSSKNSEGKHSKKWLQYVKSGIKNTCLSKQFRLTGKSEYVLRYSIKCVMTVYTY